MKISKSEPDSYNMRSDNDEAIKTSNMVTTTNLAALENV